MSPRLHKYQKNVKASKFGMSTVVIRWMLQKNKGKRNSDGKDEKEEGNDIDDDREEYGNKECEDKNNKPEIFTWVAREVKNCRKDLKELAHAIVEQLETRFANCYPEVNQLLHQCLDFGISFDSLGEATTTVPVNKVTFAKVGAKEFTKRIRFVSRFLLVSSLSLAICEELSGSIFLKFKETLLDIVSGKCFTDRFPKFIKALEEKEHSLEEKKLFTYVHAKSFERVLGFSLTEIYQFKLSDGSAFRVVLQKQLLIEALYTQSQFYSKVGQQFCIVFDIFYSKTGTEAVAESFSRVVEKQEM